MELVLGGLSGSVFVARGAFIMLQMIGVCVMIGVRDCVCQLFTRLVTHTAVIHCLSVYSSCDLMRGFQVNRGFFCINHRFGISFLYAITDFPNK